MKKYLDFEKLASLLPSSCVPSKENNGRLVLDEVTEYLAQRLYQSIRLSTYTKQHPNVLSLPILETLVQERKDQVASLLLQVPLQRDESKAARRQLYHTAMKELEIYNRTTGEEKAASLHQLPFIRSLSEHYLHLTNALTTRHGLKTDDVNTSAYHVTLSLFMPSEVISQGLLWIWASTTTCIEHGIPLFEFEDFTPHLTTLPRDTQHTKSATQILDDMHKAKEAINVHIMALVPSMRTGESFALLRSAQNYMVLLEKYIRSLDIFLCGLK
ncbi:hypothetical protein COW46_03675 [Candidatus Gracilibacteria bacterium CG17_big_fil_post_rev_8_21_14_2_50_48_13]|nr:MAG: hypothetical protein COW46_03675 [Candidatus Gracilibacteria bacterium CG17_big_fil_post_rev_8_21_14_2_50_48_13]